MEELEKHIPNENVHNNGSNPPPPTYISATCSEQDCSAKSKHKSSTSSPKMTEKQNNHQASILGMLIASLVT
jgi:hypothetical protein